MKRLREFLDQARAGHALVMNKDGEKKSTSSGSVIHRSAGREIIIIYSDAASNPGRFSSTRETAFDFGNGKVIIDHEGNVTVSDLSSTLKLRIKRGNQTIFETLSS
jgi:hypothetical protein